MKTKEGFGSVRRATARRGVPWWGEVQRGRASQGQVWPDKARQGEAGQGMEGDWQSPGFEAPAPALAGRDPGEVRLATASNGIGEVGLATARPGKGERHTSGFESRTPTHGEVCWGWAWRARARSGRAGSGEFWPGAVRQGMERGGHTPRFESVARTTVRRALARQGWARQAEAWQHTTVDRREQCQ